MKSEILRMLKESEKYLSGQELCEKFGVSRTAIWKVVKQLEAEGYLIEAVRNKGYRLKTAGDFLSQAELESSISTQWAGKNIVYYNEIDSTNTAAKKAAEAGAPHGTLVVSDYQSMGKGRRGKTWSAPHGVGIWMSLIMRPELPPSAASMLTLVAAMAVAEGLDKATDGVLKAQIKWPNDIVSGGKKICGILTEMSTELECINYVVTGMGINANTEEFPEDIETVASSILLETGKRLNRSKTINCIMQKFETYYKAFVEAGNMSGLIKEYNSRLANKDNTVKVLKPGGGYTGISLGINDSGALLVKTEDGTIHSVISGEVSVRGVYGYV